MQVSAPMTVVRGWFDWFPVVAACLTFFCKINYIIIIIIYIRRVVRWEYTEICVVLT